LGEYNQNQIIFIQAHECSEKLLYQKSPFRRIDKQKRVREQVPKDVLKCLSFGFPEDEAMGSDSSEDEEAAAARNIAAFELNKEKIKNS
jgi:hypothetical protein